MLKKLQIYLLIILGVVWCSGTQCVAADTKPNTARQMGKGQMPGNVQIKLRSTSNQMGFEDTAVNDLLQRFLDFAPVAPGHLMDIGCAKGFAVQQIVSLETKKPFLKPRKRKIFAVDMSKKHVRHIANNFSGDLVEPFQMRFPAAESPDAKKYFSPGTLGAVYAGLVLHYLDGPELREGLGLLFKSLAPGGRLYASVNSPLDSLATTEDFLHRKNITKEEYPGWFKAYDKTMLPEFIRNQIPDFIHVFDVDTLTGYAQDAGFKVIDCYYFERGPGMMMKKLLGIIAEKPATSSSRPTKPTQP